MTTCEKLTKISKINFRYVMSQISGYHDYSNIKPVNRDIILTPFRESLFLIDFSTLNSLKQRKYNLSRFFSLS